MDPSMLFLSKTRKKFVAIVTSILMLVSLSIPSVAFAVLMDLPGSFTGGTAVDTDSALTSNDVDAIVLLDTGASIEVFVGGFTPPEFMEPYTSVVLNIEFMMGGMIGDDTLTLSYDLGPGTPTGATSMTLPMPMVEDITVSMDVTADRDAMGGWTNADLAGLRIFATSSMVGGSPDLATYDVDYMWATVDGAAPPPPPPPPPGMDTPPTATNLAITPSSPVTTDDLVASYDYDDIDGETEEGSVITWFVDDGAGFFEFSSTTCATTCVGNTISEVSTTRGQSWYFTLTPCNFMACGTMATSPTVVIGNSAPVLAPVGDRFGTEGVLLEFTITAGDLDDDPITYAADGAPMSLGATIDPVMGVFSWTPDLDESGSYFVTFFAGDGTESDSEMIMMTIADAGGPPPNAPPTATDLAITPEFPLTDDTLFGSYTYSDPESDPESGSIMDWYQNGVLVMSGGMTVDPSMTTKGDSWFFTVTPCNAFGCGAMETSLTVTIGNTPPVIDPVADAFGTEGMPMTFTVTGSDVDADPLTFFVVEPLPVGASLDPMTGVFSWMPDFDQAGAYPHTFEVFDGTDSAFDPATLFVADAGGPLPGPNMPPSASDLSISPPVPTTSSDLVGAYLYDDPEGDPEVGSEIRWYEDTGSGPMLRPEFNDTLFVPDTAVDKNETWYFTVMPCDPFGCGAISTSPTVTVLNTPPTMTDIILSPDPPMTNDILESFPSAVDADGDPITFAYTWAVNSIGLPSEGSSTLNLATPGNGNKDDFVTSSVTAMDDESVGDTMGVSTMVVNTPPSFSLSLTPDPPFTNEPLLLAEVSSLGDADGDPVMVSYTWFLNGGPDPIFGETGDTLNLSVPGNGDRGDTVSVVVEAFDGTIDTTESADTVVANTDPVLEPVGNKAVDEGATLDITLGAFDVDPGDSSALTFFQTGDPTPGSTFDTSAGAFSWPTVPGQAGYYFVTFGVMDPVPGFASEDIVITVGALDQPPEITATFDVFTSENSTVSTFLVSATDPDGDPITYSATGLPAGSTLDPVTGIFDWTPGFDQAGVYAVTVTVSSGGPGVPTDSADVMISVDNVNQLPVLASVGDRLVMAGATLVIDLEATDPDGDPITFGFTAVPDPSGTVLDPLTGLFTWTPDVSQVGSYEFTFTATDGIDTDSETVTITVTSDIPPVLAPIGPQSVTVFTVHTFTVSGSDANLDPLIFSVDPLPAGATFDSSTGVFSWIAPVAAAATTFTATFTVTSGSPSQSDTEVVTFTVASLPSAGSGVGGGGGGVGGGPPPVTVVPVTTVIPTGGFLAGGGATTGLPGSPTSPDLGEEGSVTADFLQPAVGGETPLIVPVALAAPTTTPTTTTAEEGVMAVDEEEETEVSSGKEEEELDTAALQASTLGDGEDGGFGTRGFLLGLAVVLFLLLLYSMARKRRGEGEEE